MNLFEFVFAYCLAIVYLASIILIFIVRKKILDKDLVFMLYNIPVFRQGNSKDIEDCQNLLSSCKLTFIVAVIPLINTVFLFYVYRLYNVLLYYNKKYFS